MSYEVHGKPPKSLADIKAGEIYLESLFDQGMLATLRQIWVTQHGTVQDTNSPIFGKGIIQFVREKMSQPDTAVQWDHYECYTSKCGSVARISNESEWTGYVNMKGGKRGLLSETFASASVAMSAVIRTWKRENEK